MDPAALNNASREEKAMKRTTISYAAALAALAIGAIGAPPASAQTP